VRWESVIIALFGTAGGLGLGIFFSWAVTKAAESQLTNYDPAPFALVLLLIAGAAAGVLAAVFPARRAAKLDVLRAIATE
jgi:putative ABC transport system permease protein